MTYPTAVDFDAPVVARHQIEITATLQSVWDRHIDVNAWMTWNPDMTVARLNGALIPGAHFDWESYGFPVTSTVYDLMPGHRILWGGTAGGITGVHEWLFSATPGGARVATNESFSGEPVLADRAGLQVALDSSLVAWLSHLKTAAETAADI